MEQQKEIDERYPNSYSLRRSLHLYLREEAEPRKVSRLLEELALDGLKARGIQLPGHTTPAYPA